MSATAETSSHAAAFAEVFAQGWAEGARGDFHSHFEPHFRPDAVFRQPLAPQAVGPAGARRLFAPIFAAIPDLHGEVLRWGPTDDGLIIELRLMGTFGGRPIAWTTLDSIVLDEEGRLRSRTAHFDPLPLLAQMARSPVTLARLLPRLVLNRRGEA